MLKVHALVIDDNPDNSRVLVQLLNLEGLTCTWLSDTADLVSNLDRLHDVSVVFLDLELPKTNGYEVLRVIKTHPNFRDVFVIAYTVHTSEINTAYEKGFDGFVGKPVNAEVFPEHLRRILNREHVWSWD